MREGHIKDGMSVTQLLDGEARERTQRLADRAESLGFDAFGVAAVDPNPDEPSDAHAESAEARLRTWLERGMHGRMTWMATSADRRQDLQLSLPGARSVVAVATSYYQSDIPAPGELKVARYAHGNDYHGWLKKRVRKLRKALLELDPGCRVYPTVDTSPVLERAWAARAGIAWIGKSTMAIHPRLGTYTFLGTLVTDSLLVPNDPLPDRCGTCTACLDLCPTDAFPEPRVLDARRCIAHWTLEAPGPLPSDTPNFDGWIAGCDVCQDVCPWNKFARPSTEPRTQARPELSHVSEELIETPGALEAAIEGTALRRTGADALRRNARHTRGERD